MAKISILIPTIGRASLEGVLEKILSNKNFAQIAPEILVFFDGEKVPEKLNKKFDQKVNFFGAKKRVGRARGRNFLIEKSGGEILVFVGDNGDPSENWLEEIQKFHQKYPQKNRAALGFVGWENPTDFQMFCQNRCQFDFQNIAKRGADWRHFYTSNISVKKDFLGKNRFSEKFGIIPPKLANDRGGSREKNQARREKSPEWGWGFEDSELGFRLEKQGLQIFFVPEITVFRTDSPDLFSVCQKWNWARQNAVIFEKLHPEIQIRPQGIRLVLLKVLIFSARFLAPFSPRIKWWREWKKVWIFGTFEQI